MAARKHTGALRGVGRTGARGSRGVVGVSAGGFASGAVLANAHAQVAEIQRSRLLAGAVAAVDELGYEATTVAQITARARISRRTFYELFENREECLAAVLQDTVAAVQRELAAAGVADLGWRERLRVGLWTVLGFLDAEPALARVCVVQALRGSGLVQRTREDVLARLTKLVDEGRSQGKRASARSPLTAEGLVGAGFAIVYARLSRSERLCTRELHGELMGMILLPYLGVATARREQARPVPAGASQRSTRRVRAPRAGDPLEGVQMRMTYRTARVLQVIAQAPGASNRLIAEQAGISDQGQISKLLARLERLGLLSNSGAGHAKGEPNVWQLTARGERVARGLGMGAVEGRRAA